LPTASVSGFYFAHPKAQYFGVSRINSQQVKDYAKRNGIDEDKAKRLLSSVI
jgi:5-methyltetrahydrofolate--homocysteine methyltransferase